MIVDPQRVSEHHEQGAVIDRHVETYITLLG
jgi:hypothetical protein